jgi:hypothetical protein
LDFTCRSFGFEGQNTVRVLKINFPLLYSLLGSEMRRNSRNAASALDIGFKLIGGHEKKVL